MKTAGAKFIRSAMLFDFPDLLLSSVEFCDFGPHFEFRLAQSFVGMWHTLDLSVFDNNNNSNNYIINRLN